ncbi:hypothetical protein C8J57DRAFT_1086116 [Mycena rebaudengoi]|nr:hypothetical protein C8J57DRAFT_1086116 [Mycena rebaudengoi]
MLDRTYKRPRTCFETSICNTIFPILLPQSEKDQIVREFCEATSNTSLKQYACSFCGKLELAADIKLISVTMLDISLLDRAVTRLRDVCHQPRIESFNASSLIDASYVLCHLCNLAVTKNCFCSIPLRSYVNGLWIGKVPEELLDLTFLEEQCIARARATKCMYKLSLGPSGQFAARGNVCILPQDTTSFLSAMPPPLSQIRAEVCVILVGSPDTEVTHDMLRKSPLLVRREKVRKALFWLIEHNPCMLTSTRTL